MWSRSGTDKENGSECGAEIVLTKKTGVNAERNCIDRESGSECGGTLLIGKAGVNAKQERH
jgi:hypothetical protein